MTNFRILKKKSSTGIDIYLPQKQTKILKLWVIVPLQVPTSVDIVYSPWNPSLNWVRKQIDVYKYRSLLTSKIEIIEVL